MSQTSKAFRLATVSADGLQWTLRRNCSVTPAQLAMTFGALGTLSLVVAVFFWFQGAVLVLPFAVIELAALSAAFFVYARHAADSERVSLQGGHLIVELETAGNVMRSEFLREWVRIEPLTRGQLVEVRSGGSSVQVGRFLRPELRPVLAREIRLALSTV
ncbi:MAG: DUF2244 domain-containing protein [Hydrogenophaga sp.]|uniref:DUF2244 domain-containing protein n=1 Tax=Hydrogenophaga sp. TaxID=1904254 RepID=UPI002ABB3403|nr:DUF2244 domain-containing protein [Hydrogenophaga sp.]MDZ4188445.1 DUF2244 domain-containing protein [Hydrogenophaga sp.]